MIRNTLAILLASILAAPALMAADLTTTYSYQSSVSSDVDGPLDLIAELNYDDAATGAPVAVVMHGFSDSSTLLSRYRDNAQRLRDQGFFVLTVLMRGRTVNEGSSDGTRDSGGVEIYDIYDAVEAVKADPTYASLVDPTSVYVTGYSGGGGNTMAALTKFPDYFRAGAAFFGMSDYGYNAADSWYFNGASSSHQGILRTDVGDPTLGDPDVEDRYLARASNLASKNNPYTEIHLFVNDNETTCPPVNDITFRDNAVAAESTPGEFDNITVHIGQAGTYYDFDGSGTDDPDEQQYWPHTAPTADQQASAEQWFIDRVLDGSIVEPVLNDDDELFVAGYVKTKKFGLWLGDGQNTAADLTYSLSNAAMTFGLDIASNDTDVTGVLTVDTSRLGGRAVDVLLNGSLLESIPAISNEYQYPTLGDGQTLRLQVVPEPAGAVLLGALMLGLLATRRRH